MSVTKLNGLRLQRMIVAGANELHANKQAVDAMNVFPVPDGDTGTNMSLTMLAAARETEKGDALRVDEVTKRASGGALRGARGNSGVITSQILRGFAKGLEGLEEAGVKELTAAMEQGVKTAYKAVMKPKEGTILTVARACAEAAVAESEKTDDIEVFLKAVLEHAHDVLNQTPDMLPVLKEAGVVDSGGQGLIEILHGAYDAFSGKEIDYTAIDASAGTKMVKPSQQAETDIKFGYCTEFIIMTDKPFSETDETEFKAYLESIGDSIVCVADDDIVKIHVHTNDPGLAIQKALTYGQLSRMKIDNMREEHQEKLIRDAEKVAEQQAQAAELKKKKEARKPVGFIAVSIGEGMNEIFRELGVDYIIQGGQTMNPSTDDMLTAIDNVNADHIFILPNNKNIILAANQAQSLTKDKDILVIPTKTVPQGITAVISYMPEADVDTNFESMKEAIGNVKTGQVTYAVRDTRIDEMDIHQGDIMGIGDQGILSVGQSVEETVKDMLTQLVDEDSELISLYYGQDVHEEDAEKFAQTVEELYPDVDIDIHMGGQPIYYYVLSVE